MARRRRRARRQLAGRVARVAGRRRSSAAMRVVTEPGVVRRRRSGAALRPARDRDRLVAGDPADRRARLGRLLDERRGDRDDRGAGAARRARRRPGRLRARAVLPARRLAGDARPERRPDPLARRCRRRGARRRRAAGGRRRDPPRRAGASRVTAGALALERRQRASRSTGCSSRPAAGRTWPGSSRSG